MTLNLPYSKHGLGNSKEALVALDPNICMGYTSVLYLRCCLPTFSGSLFLAEFLVTSAAKRQPAEKRAVGSSMGGSGEQSTVKFNK